MTPKPIGYQTFFAELRRRKVVRVAIVYAAVAFAILQAADLVIEAVQVPEWTLAFVLVICVLGFPIALVLAWAFEITPEGVHRTVPAYADPATARAESWLPIRTAALVAGLLVAGVAAGWFLHIPISGDAASVGPASSVVRFRIALPAIEPLVPLAGPRIAISPDGRRIAYAAGRSVSSWKIWVRELDGLDAEPIAGTEGARSLFFSPDGRWIVYRDQRGGMKRVSVTGGAPFTISNVVHVSGDWGPDDRILFSRRGVLAFVPAAGGDTTVLAASEGGSQEYWAGVVLPGGRAALITIPAPDPADHQIAAISLENGEVTPLVPGGHTPVYVPTGHLLFARPDGSVAAVEFDPSRLEVTGSPVPVLEGVQVRPDGAADYAVSKNGTLVYLSATGASTLLMVDRLGRVETLTSRDENFYGPRFSPDGVRIALNLSRDVWSYDLRQGLLARLTFEGENIYPEWTPDGARISFSSLRAGSDARNLYWRPADGGGTASPVRILEEDQYEASWSRDGRWLVYREVDANGRDVYAIELGGDSTPIPILDGPFDERSIALSPDGNWLAYVSSETGQDEVFVRRFPDREGGKWQVSRDGGVEPAWSRDGRELFYRRDTELIAVRVDTASGFTAGAREVLFDGPYIGSDSHTNYDVHPDGERFVMIRQENGDLVVVLNWFEELERILTGG
ncbi:MAG: PD40 domain-containing protein [Gemmatimonadota bacterium]|nr:MAG: PD40 domain-containing protein [Gemmatimonadota bacterium]